MSVGKNWDDDDLVGYGVACQWTPAEFGASCDVAGVEEGLRKDLESVTALLWRLVHKTGSGYQLELMFSPQGIFRQIVVNVRRRYVSDSLGSLGRKTSSSGFGVETGTSCQAGS